MSLTLGQALFVVMVTYLFLGALWTTFVEAYLRDALLSVQQAKARNVRVGRWTWDEAMALPALKRLIAANEARVVWVARLLGLVAWLPLLLLTRGWFYDLTALPEALKAISAVNAEDEAQIDRRIRSIVHMVFEADQALRTVLDLKVSNWEDATEEQCLCYGDMVAHAMMSSDVADLHSRVTTETKLLVAGGWAEAGDDLALENLSPYAKRFLENTHAIVRMVMEQWMLVAPESPSPPLED